jgi:hypothetical protein
MAADDIPLDHVLAQPGLFCASLRTDSARRLDVIALECTVHVVQMQRTLFVCMLC